MTCTPGQLAGMKRYRERNPNADREAHKRLRENKPAKYLMHRVRARARREGLDCDITEEWIEVRLPDGCEVTGLPFDFEVGTPGKQNPWTPSVDRKDSSKGYTEDNCQLVVWAYNCAKGTWDKETVMEMAEALLSHEADPEVFA